MNKEQIKQILKLDNDFYNTVSKDFSSTRQSFWPGWNSLLPYIEKFKHPKILDLACGNGRFFKFLIQNTLSCDYLGLDNNTELLAEAQKLGGNFQKLDVISETDKIPEKFDIVVAFGITHHIPDTHFRRSWFKNISEKLTKDGLFVFTIWNIEGDSRFIKRAVKAENLDDGDFYYDWDNNSKRYVHIYNDIELQNIISCTSLKLLEKYNNDGKNSKLNTYYILKK